MDITEDQVNELADHILKDQYEMEWFCWESWAQEESNPFLSVYCTALRVLGNDDRDIFDRFHCANMQYSPGYNGGSKPDYEWQGPCIVDLIEYVEEGFGYTEEEAEELVKEFLPVEYKKYKNNSDYLVEM